MARGLVARLLYPLSALVCAWAHLRHAAYRHGLFPAQGLGLPVIVVGNLIVGGAGKTPATLAVIEHLRTRGWRPGVLSRGHGRRPSDEVVAVGPDTRAELCGDEPLLIHRRTGVPVFVHRDRVRAGLALRQAHPEIDVLVADDGLQHLRLRRALEVLVFDRRGLGNGWCLPAGPLREPPGAASTAPQRLVLYTDGRASTPLAGHVGHRELAGVQVFEDWQARATAGARPLSSLAGRQVVACAGIAQPRRFFDALRTAGLKVEERPLPDHAPYAPDWFEGQGPWVLTEKDAVKLPSPLPPHAVGRVWVAALDFRAPPSFFAALDAALYETARHGSTSA